MSHIEKTHPTLAIAAAFVLVTVLAGGCNSNIVSDDSSADKMTTVAGFNASSGELPESIAVDRFGNIYMSMSPSRQVWKLDPSGTSREVVASFPLEPGLFGVNGLRFDPQGNLYVAVSSTLAPMNGVWKIASNGEKERIAGTSSILLPNDVAVLPNGTLYITDSAAGAVWRYMPGGQAELWIQDEILEGTGAFGLGVPIGANGIVVTQEGLMVANSEKGQLVLVPILPDGSAGDPKIVIAAPAALFGLDGITADAQGAIYGAVNFANKIVRISSDGSSLSEIASGAPLDFPTSLAFGTDGEESTLFIVNFSVIHFLHDPQTAEDANPALLSVRVDS